MAKDSFVQARIEKPLKERAEKILDKLGITRSQAFTMFYKQILLNKGIPFELKIPNKDTEATIIEAKKGQNVIKYSNKKEMFKDLKNELKA